MGNSPSTSSMKQQLEISTVTPDMEVSTIPYEGQYDRNSAYSIVAYKNQAEGSYSDLDAAKMNFENTYKKFLILYGQYSNTPLVDYKTKKVFEYPISQRTPIFDSYPNLKPT